VAGESSESAAHGEAKAATAALVGGEALAAIEEQQEVNRHE
jgi:hypothetical protein